MKVGSRKQKKGSKMFSEAEKEPITVRWVMCLGAEQTQL